MSECQKSSAGCDICPDCTDFQTNLALSAVAQWAHTHGMDDVEEIAVNLINDDLIVHIAFAGTLWDQDELCDLQEALEVLFWQEGKDVGRVRILGRTTEVSDEPADTVEDDEDEDEDDDWGY